MSETDCRICELSSADVLVSSERSEAFYSPEPLAAGHLVVAVRAHKPTMADLSASEASDLFSLARDIVSVAQERLGTEKFYLAAVGDVDKHFHLHLLPKKKDDPGLGPFIFGPAGWKSKLAVPEAPGEELTEAIRRLGERAAKS